MTPYDVACGLADFLKECMEENEERLGADGDLFARNVYAGFLPRARNAADLEKLCPAVVFRPETATDESDRSIASIVAYVTVFDKDIRHGCESLFHLLEFVRAQLLMNNTVKDKYWIQPGMKMSVPDDQPYPQWIGILEFDVIIPQVRSTTGPIGWWTR